MVPAAAEEDDLVTGEAVPIDLRPAGFALRAAGAAIDILATAVVAACLIRLVFWAVPGDTAMITALIIVVLALCLIVGPVTVETLTRGKSLGRLAVGARIVRDDGGAITVRHAFVRALTGIVELYMTLGGLAALIGLLSPRTKRLGDVLAGTYAMHERVPRPFPLLLPVPEPLLDWARIADVARMPDPLARRIAAFLRQAPGMSPGSREALARALAAEAARYAHPVPPAPPEAFLAGVAALRREREAAALSRQAALFERLEPVISRRRGMPERG